MAIGRRGTRSVAMLAIVNVAYPFAPVDADPVGGAEQIVATLDRFLAGSGHESTVIAHAESRVQGRLVAAPSAAQRAGAAGGSIDGEARARVKAAHREVIARSLDAGRVDVVHLHGVDFLDYLPATRVPVLVTLHLPLGWYPRDAFAGDLAARLICVSHSQRRIAQALGVADAVAERLTVVENGVELERYWPADVREDFALMLGRVCPEKGFDAAIRAARRAGVKLILAGTVFPYAEHQRYFDEVVAPQLDGRRRFIGPISGAAKRELLGRARCVLVPSRVDETSSLVAMEALASGTPVIAFRRGALPEIIEHGRTGFLVDTEEEMADAIVAVTRNSSADCRAAAEARCSAATMTRRYLELYEQAARARPPSSRPVALDLEEIRDDALLAALEPEWSELFDRCPDATPFQSPEWLLAARRHLPGGSAPHVLAVRRGERLVGLVPTQSKGGAITWIGAGITDSLDLIAEPGLRERVAGAALAHLAATRGSWTGVELDALPAGSPLVTCPLPDGWWDEVARGEPSPVLRLPAAVPQRVASDRRRLERVGSARWRTADEASAPELLATLFELHRARWRSRGEEGVLAHPAVQRFHLDAGPRLARRGLLRLQALELDGRIIAVLYGLTRGARACYYLSGFAPEAGRLSPGVLLVAHAIDVASAEGASEFDFLRGREAYKYEWGAVDRPAFVRRIRHA